MTGNREKRTMACRPVFLCSHLSSPSPMGGTTHNEGGPSHLKPPNLENPSHSCPRCLYVVLGPVKLAVNMNHGRCVLRSEGHCNLHSHSLMLTFHAHLHHFSICQVGLLDGIMCDRTIEFHSLLPFPPLLCCKVRSSFEVV